MKYSNDHCLIYSQFICSAFNNILSKFKIPYMAWPFNVIATASFMALHAFYEGDKMKGKSYFFDIEMSYLCPLPFVIQILKCMRNLYFDEGYMIRYRM